MLSEYCDLSKAFDCVEHKKPMYYCANGEILDPIASACRNQNDSINEIQ